MTKTHKIEVQEMDEIVFEYKFDLINQVSAYLMGINMKSVCIPPGGILNAMVHHLWELQKTNGSLTTYDFDNFIDAHKI
jgi:hypothetical protein